MPGVRLLLVDDHAIFRRGLRDILSDTTDLEVVGEASDGNEALEKALASLPNVVLMDLHMPECDGITATVRILQEVPETRILILTISENEVDLLEAIKAGARGYLLKEEEPEQVALAVRQVARGGVVCSASMANHLLEVFKFSTAKPSVKGVNALSPREREVLELVAEGASNKVISRELRIAESTVKVHLMHIFEKLHLANRTQAAAYATGIRFKKD